MLTKDLMDAQREMEQRSMSEGYARFTKEQETTKVHEGPYATSDASKVIQGCIPLVAKAISSWVESTKAKKGKTHSALAVLERFDNETLAFVALNQVFSACVKTTALPSLLVVIGSILENEVIAQDLEVERGHKVAKRIREQVNKQGSASNRKKAFRKLAKAVEMNGGEWPNEFKAKIGEPLVACVLKSLSPLFELASHTQSKNHTKNTIRLTPEGVELVASIKEGIAWNAPVLRPMVVKPRPWETLDTGCYYEERAARTVRLVRTYDKGQQKQIRQAIAQGSMDNVLEAVNAIQETPWAINLKVLEVLEYCWKNDLEVPGLPASRLVQLPERMDPQVYKAMSDFERKGIRINIAQLREKNRGIVADRAVMLRDLDTARELSKYERFYLPHSLDFRGRVYPVCHFSHQRSDCVKALFRFAEGVPYGETGAAWASVHLANCGDFAKVSKQPFESRLDWVLSAEANILGVANDPIGTFEWWTGADKPFQFLASCFEYAAWVDSGRDEGFAGYLPVALDGSNSGLQHYSAALRAEDEAALVSLTPSLYPADLYQTVADVVKEEVVEDVKAEYAAGTFGAASLALNVGITRSLVKRNVMTFAYSSAQFGFRQQLLDDTMRPLNDAVLTGDIEFNPWSMDREDGTTDGGWQASHYLSKKVWGAVTKVVTRATEGMEFFKKVAGTLAKHGHPLTWTSPLGLPCTHAYRVWAVKTVQLFLYDRAVPVVDAGPSDRIEDDCVMRRVEANIRTKPTEALDKDKARSAVAPNVIHSMDGSHLMLSVLDAKDAGIKNFALIHDSFGTHAGRTLEFGAIVRGAFVNLYENYCPFEEVYNSAKEALEGDPEGLLPLPPTKGSFDIRQVLESHYAFA